VHGRPIASQLWQVADWEFDAHQFVWEAHPVHDR
jgi:hypothetical protein